MKPTDDERPLTDAYRQASSDDAGRPSAATRKAILAAAAAAARKQAPAANDSRYLWRGVAGVAVVGFALLMWQQVDHQMPGDAPVIAQSTELLESAESARRIEGARNEAAPAAPPSAVAPMPGQRMAAADTAAAAANAGAPLREEEMAALQAAPAASVPAQTTAEGARSLSKMSAAADAETDADALLRLNFPRQYQSATPHRLWLVQDGSGKVLRSGELSMEQDFAGMRAEIERDLDGQLLRPWRIRSLRNAQGQIIELGVAQTP